MVRFAVFLVVLFFGINSFAYTMSQLFEGLKRQPVTKIDMVLKKEAKTERSRVVGEFFPKIYGVASYTHYNAPTSLRPVTPTESTQIIKINGVLPFSQNIKQIGIKFSMPLFILPLFDLKSMSEKLVKSAQERQKLNFISNEAAIVSTVFC